MKAITEKVKNFVDSLGLILQVYLNGEPIVISWEDDCCFGKTSPGDEVELRVHIPASPQGDADVEVVPCGFRRIQPRKGEVAYQRLEPAQSNYADAKVVSHRVKVEKDDEGNGIATWPANAFSLVVRQGLKLSLIQLSASYDKDRKLGVGYDGYYIVDILKQAPLCKDKKTGRVSVRDAQFLKVWGAMLPHLEEAFGVLKPRMQAVDANSLGAHAQPEFSKFNESERNGGWAVCRFFNKAMRKGALEMVDRDGETDGRVVVIHAQSLVDQEGFRALEQGDKVFVKYLQRQSSTGYAEAREVTTKAPPRKRRRDLDDEDRPSLADLLKD